MNKDLDDRLIPNGEYRDAQNISVGKSEADDIGSLEPIIGNTIDDSQSLQDSTAIASILRPIGSSTVTLTANPGIGNGANIGMALIAGGITYGYIKERNLLVLTLVNVLTVAIPATTVLTFTIPNLKVIGSLADESNSRIITFLTDNLDSNNATSPSFAPSTGLGSNHFIKIGSTFLVSGNFLNFSQNAFITGINLIENLLFWTDNRNQPRKINLDLANNIYYNDENSISVAKYNPYEPITLIKKTTATSATSAAAVITLAAQNTAIKQGMNVISVNNIGGSVISPTQYLYVTAIATVAPWTVTLNATPTVNIIATDVLTFLNTTMTGEEISPYFNETAMPASTNWPGDPDYLEDKFVRFSYRFKFDDGEYSIMAPFTQIAYIPKQKGYFIGSGGTTATPIDEDNAYRSTILDFMQNGVQNIELLIPLPDTGQNIASKTRFKINSIDILYKESDGVSVKVLDNILASTLSTTTGITYTYDYQSRKPYKTLPSSQTTRVYDRVPVRAFSQEMTGNRVIYGNFQDKHTSPTAFNYNVAVGDKALTPSITNWAEYPNHSIKQNRNYQVGFILSDKWGRQSTVILSTVDDGTLDGIFYGGSTIYIPYNSSTSDVRNWFGDALKLIINEGIGTTTKNFPAGVPGLYATPVSSSGWNTYNATPADQPSFTTTAPYTYTFTLGATYTTVPTEGSYLRGENIDYVKVITVPPPVGSVYIVTCDGPVNQAIYGQTTTADPDRKFNYTLDNPLGWYSYKVVVRQQEQDYYNVYLPGILNGYPLQIPTTPLSGTVNTPGFPGAATQIVLTTPLANLSGGMVIHSATGQELCTVVSFSGATINTTPLASGVAIGEVITFTNVKNFIPFPTDEDGETAHIVLFNDNINKVPRDLAKVGPEQKQFRSSVQLYGRVENTMTTATAFNKQFFGITPSFARASHTAIAIGEAEDLNIIYTELSSPGGKENFYQIDTNPLIGRISTPTAIGVISTTDINTNMKPYLAIYETEPVDSLLDIFWETTQVGLIADLNSAIETDSNAPVGFEAMAYAQDESMNTATPLTVLFHPVDSANAPIPATTGILTVTSSSFDGLSVDNRSSEFQLYQELGAGVDQYKYQIRSNALFDFTQQSYITDKFTFTIQLTSWDFSTGLPLSPEAFPPTDLIFSGSLVNITPCFWDGSACYTGVALPDVSATVSDTSNIVTRNAVNGSFAENITDLFYSLDAATVTAGYFTIDSTTSQIDKDINTPIGVYNLTISVQDAYGTDNTINEHIVKSMTQKITVGPTSLNSEAFSSWGCVTKGNYSVAPGYVAGQIISDLTGSTAYGAFYLTVLDQGVNPTFTIPDGGGGTATFTPSADDTVTGYRYYHRIGTGDVTAGTVVFSCNVSQTYSSQPSPSYAGPDGNTNWKIYYRVDATQPWGFATDINSGVTDASGVVTNTQVTTWYNGIGNPYTSYSQTVFSFDTLGEYLITATSITTRANVQADATISWVNSNDLYNSSCVVENGSDKTDGGTPKVYAYRLTLPTSSYTCTTPTSTTAYAQTPYANYVTEFYTTSGLGIITIPATPYFYGFATDSTASEPFSGSIYSAKFDSVSGIKTSNGLMSPPCSGSRLALGCAGVSTSCAHITIEGSNNTY